MTSEMDVERARPALPRGSTLFAHCTLLIATVAACVPLFLHHWVHVDVEFISRNPTGSAISQRLGGELDKQIAAIAEREVNTTIAPTMWHYQGHIFQIVFALLLLVVALTLLARLIPAPWHLLAHGVACLSAVAAAIIVALSTLRITARIDALPARITDAIAQNALLKQAIARTNTTPQITGGPRWPFVVTAIGVGLTVLSAVTILILALRRPEPDGIPPQAHIVQPDQEGVQSW